MTHTPGPWTVQTNGDGSQSIAGGVSPDPVTNARYLWVANVLPTQSENPLWRQEDERNANAQLIAAAPDLLYAVMDVRERLESWIDGLAVAIRSLPSNDRTKVMMDERDNYAKLVGVLGDAIAKAEGTE